MSNECLAEIEAPFKLYPHFTRHIASTETLIKKAVAYAGWKLMASANGRISVPPPIPSKFPNAESIKYFSANNNSMIFLL
jgi:hypothetical protein